MPLSQAISDTDCIMREYNQLTAAGSYGERMILNRNQYKLNLTLSLAERRRRAGDKEGSGGTRLGLGPGRRVLRTHHRQQPPCRQPLVPLVAASGGGQPLHSLPHPIPPLFSFLSFFFPPLPTACSIFPHCQAIRAVLFQEKKAGGAE